MSKREEFGSVLFAFAILLLFSACLAFVNIWTLSYVSERNSGQYASALTYILHPMVEILDNNYINDVDRPMEALIDSSPYISYSFTSPLYPANDALIDRLTDDLQKLTETSKAISGAFIYTSATDSYLASPSLSGPDSPLPDSSANIRDIIYNYNTGTLQKKSLSAGDHLTFMLQYRDFFLVSKELTSRSGLASSTMFLLLDMNHFTSYLFETKSLTPYYHANINIGIYDDSNKLLYCSDALDVDTANEVLWHTPGETDIIKLGDHYGVSFRSDVINWRYAFVVDRNFLSTFTQTIGNRDIMVTNIVTTLLLIALTLLILSRLGRSLSDRLVAMTEKLSLHGHFSLFSRPSVLQQLADAITESTKKRDELQSIVSYVSTEAVSMLFFRMLAGGQIDNKLLQVTLKHTDLGFGENDVYVAGVVACEDDAPLELETRYSIHASLEHALQRFCEKGECCHIVLTLDAPFFAIVLSFPPETSIAKGKQTLNSLNLLIAGAFSQKGQSIAIHFGHMYHSIYDLPFSFHEAMKGRQAAAEPEQQPANNALPSQISPLKASEDTPAIVHSQTNAESDLGAMIDRRATQITELVLDGKRESISQLIDRTLAAIFAEGDFGQKSERAKRLINAITEAMVSHDFILPDYLTDVSGLLSEQIHRGLDEYQLVERTQQGVYTLCDDFGKIIKRQNNPYIVAALEYIDANYMNPNLTLEVIADGLKIAPNYLSSLFSKTLGRKLFEYIGEMRLKKSLPLLLNTRDTINEISEKSGFGSSRNYIRIFKKYMDTTPSAYRKHNLSASDASETEE